MSIPIKNVNRISPPAVVLILSVVILLITGCAPRASGFIPPDAESTAIVISTPTESPASTPAEGNTSEAPASQASEIPLTFLPDADAYVDQAEPDTNFGRRSIMKVDSGSDSFESFIRFTVTETFGTVKKATLRVYATSNGSNDGPAIYTVIAPWDEETLNWNNRPSSSGAVLDNREQINSETWVEYDVTAAVTGKGIYSFIITPDSGDAITFATRETTRPPELVVIFSPKASVAPIAAAAAGEAILAGAGDISHCSNDNDELTAQLLDKIPGTVFTTGDNAYDAGSYAQYMDCYDKTWGRHKDRTRPIPGNHDYDTADASGYYRYFDNVAPYYSYELGTWRIYALNSEIDVQGDSAQAQWLTTDLETHPAQCVLAYWHEPRWSSGSTHGNSREMGTLWRALYEADAELVLNGHEHNYERFAPMDAEGQAEPQGLREIVIGTGGGGLYPFGPVLPTTEIRNNTTYGVLKLTLRTNSYDWEFIPVAGSTFTDSGSTECH